MTVLVRDAVEVRVRSGTPVERSDDDARSHGLVGLRERAEDFGGVCDLQIDELGSTLRWTAARPA